MSWPEEAGINNLCQMQILFSNSIIDTVLLIQNYSLYVNYVLLIISQPDVVHVYCLCQIFKLTITFMYASTVFSSAVCHMS